MTSRKLLFQIILVFIIAYTGSTVVFAGRVHDLISDDKVSDFEIQGHLEGKPRDIEQMIRQPFADPIGVLEAAARKNRWELVYWILRKYPNIEINWEGRPTLLRCAIMRGAAEATRVYNLRTDANPSAVQHHTLLPEAGENEFLLAAAELHNWELFRDWLPGLTQDPIAPVLTGLGKTEYIRKTILDYITSDLQFELFTDLLHRHIDEQGYTIPDRNLALLSRDPSIYLAFRKAAILELMRRQPERFTFKTIKFLKTTEHDRDFETVYRLGEQLQILFSAVANEQENLPINSAHRLADALPRIREADRDLALLSDDFLSAAWSAYTTSRFLGMIASAYRMGSPETKCRSSAEEDLDFVGN